MASFWDGEDLILDYGSDRGNLSDYYEQLTPSASHASSLYEDENYYDDMMVDDEGYKEDGPLNFPNRRRVHPHNKYLQFGSAGYADAAPKASYQNPRAFSAPSVPPRTDDVFSSYYRSKYDDPYQQKYITHVHKPRPPPSPITMMMPSQAPTYRPEFVPDAIEPRRARLELPNPYRLKYPHSSPHRYD
jgi:hypothetical protein